MKETIEIVLGVVAFGCIMTLPVWCWVVFKVAQMLGLAPM